MGCKKLRVILLLLAQFYYCAKVSGGNGNDVYNGVETDLSPNNLYTVPVRTFPFAVRIMYKHQSNCGGTILTDRVVITSAGCLVSRGHRLSLPDVRVVTGVSTYGTGVKYQIINATFNSAYNYDNGTDSLALLLIKGQIKFNSSVQLTLIAPINLKWRVEGQPMLTVGYKPVQDTYGMRASLVYFYQCRKADKKKDLSHAWYKIEADCITDYGYGVFVNRYLVGVVSNAYHWCDRVADNPPKDPNVSKGPLAYIDVNFYTGWIRTTIQELTHPKPTTIITTSSPSMKNYFD